jgi:hypothetical protein
MGAQPIRPRSGEERAAYIQGYQTAAKTILTALENGRSVPEVRAFIDATTGLMDATHELVEER